MPRPFRRDARRAGKCDQPCHPDGVIAPLKSGRLWDAERVGKPGRLKAKSMQKLLMSVPGEARVPVPGAGAVSIELTVCSGWRPGNCLYL